MMSKRKIPPKLARRILLGFLRQDLDEEVEGDLEEKFHSILKEKSLFRARLNYWYQVFHYMRPFAIRKSSSHSNHYAMFQSYFKVGYRNLLKNKGYSLINIGGLAIGLTIVTLIGLWIRDEFLFDRYNKNYERIAQVMQHYTVNGNKGTGNAIPIPLYTELSKSYENDFKYLVLSSWTGDHILSHEETILSKSGNYMDVDGPKLLNLKMLEGTLDGLQGPGSILLSQSAAKAFFGEDDPINQQMKLDNRMDVKVSGVYEDLPFNSEFKDLAFIAPWQLYIASEPWVKNAETQWGNNSFQLYAQIGDHADMEKVNAKIRNIRYDKGDERDKVWKPEIFLHPMKDWHLRSNWENGVQTGGGIQYVWLFGIIGIFVLMLACINFMNLSTARSEQRAKEVGIRKSIGSIRTQLITQFFSESFLVVALAFIASVLFVNTVIPFFNDLTGKRIQFPFNNYEYWLISFGFVIGAGILAGSYPAFYLSSFRPVKVLKGTFKAGRLTSLPRKILVVLQFTVSVSLIIGTVVVYQQIQYTKNRPIGYDNNNIIMIQMKSMDFYGKYDLLRDELRKEGAIVEMAESSSPLTGVWANNSGFNWQGKDPDLLDDFATIWVTHDFGKTIGWQIVDGRDFSRDFASDSSALIINEAAVKFMNLERPVGTVVHWGDDVEGRDFTIIGVVKDMLMESPFKAVKQTFYVNGYDDLSWMELKLNPANSASESITRIEKIFKKYLPDVPFDFQFANQAHAQKFASEERIGALSGIFAVLAILISSLGLFGLASFVAEQRTKEIGIRKVLGASVSALWKMLSKDFVLLVIIASIIAIPAAYYFMDNWLQRYEYRMEISWWIFPASIFSAITITLLTVSFQAIRAALMNPVKSLRSE